MNNEDNDIGYLLGEKEALFMIGTALLTVIFLAVVVILAFKFL